MKRRIAILPITPELLIEFLGLEKFRVIRTQYDFARDAITFILENDIFPEVEPYEIPTDAMPVYEKTGPLQIRLKEIKILSTGETIKAEDITSFKEVANAK
jgi:hypothetical protein